MTCSLESFLMSHNLQQYYPCFLETGATDQDLPQLAQLNDQEISEYLQVVQMLPFHAIKLKRALREYRSDLETPQFPRNPVYAIEKEADHQPVLETQFTPSLCAENGNNDNTHQVIMSHAIIYGKNSTRPLTSYEQAINSASVQLALQDTSLLIHKGKLFEMAKKKLLEEGYQYKRGKSRSKLRDRQHQPLIFQNGVAMATGVDIPGHSVTVDTSASDVKKNDRSRATLLEKKYTKHKEHASRQSDQRLKLLRQLETKLDNIRKSLLQIDNNNIDTDNDDESNSGKGQHCQNKTQLENAKNDIVKQISKLKAQERKHQWYKRKTQLKYEQQQELQPLQQKQDTRSSSPPTTLQYYEDEKGDASASFLQNRMLPLPLPSPPHSTQSPPLTSASAFFSSCSSPSLSPPPSSSSPSLSNFYFRPLPASCKQSSTTTCTSSASRQSDVRAKVLTVRDCCTYDSPC